MTARAWWCGIALLATALLVHALIPRYEWRPGGGEIVNYIRFDRWTGSAQWGQFARAPGYPDGAWIPTPALNAARAPQ